MSKIYISMGSTAAATLLLLLAVVPAVFSVSFQVGDNSGWNGGVNYTTWIYGKTFRVGDTLEFQYGPSHSVSVVDKAGYDRCDNSGAAENFSGGDTKINLTTVGTIHFICPTHGHCLDGMKLAVPVLPAASSPPTTPSPLCFPYSPPISPRYPAQPKTPTSSSANGTPESDSSTPSPRQSTFSRFKEILGYEVMVVGIRMPIKIWLTIILARILTRISSSPRILRISTLYVLSVVSYYSFHVYYYLGCHLLCIYFLRYLRYGLLYLERLFCRYYYTN